MIDTILNLLFRCRHRRVTRPVATITKPGKPGSRSYVVCLDCGKQFEYDLEKMRIGKAIDQPAATHNDLPKASEAAANFTTPPR